MRLMPNALQCFGRLSNFKITTVGLECAEECFRVSQDA